MQLSVMSSELARLNESCNSVSYKKGFFSGFLLIKKSLKEP